MSWLLLALLQTATVTLLLLVSAALLRRATRSASPVAIGVGRVAAARGEMQPDEPESAPTKPLLSQRGAATAMHDTAEADSSAALRDGWARLRVAFHAVLSGAQPVLQNSVWSELHRLLCAADQLLGLPSPAIEFRDEDLDADARWNTLSQGLDELRAAIAGHTAQGPDEATTQALLAALVQTVDELRHEHPEQTHTESNRETELRKMILQFTTDSRDMLICVRRLESENAELRSKLGVAPASEAS